MRHPLPPWPHRAEVPRWARNWRGRHRRPRRYERLGDSDSACYHVALYPCRTTAHVVVIIEPSHRAADIDFAGGADRLKIRRYRRRLGTAGFEVALNLARQARPAPLAG